MPTSQPALVVPEESIAQAIADYGGDIQVAFRALLDANMRLKTEREALKQDIADITAMVSKAYARDIFYTISPGSERLKKLLDYTPVVLK